MPQPMKPAREVVTDAETGEELIRITPKPHWRKAKGKKQRVETAPDIPPDEKGVEADGGGRIGSVASEPLEENRTGDADALQPPEAGDDEPVAVAVSQPEPPPEEPSDEIPELTPEQELALAEEASPQPSEPVSDETEQPAEEESQEPAQDDPPVQPRALLAAAE